MAKLSRELKASGVNVIDLSLGEPDFRTPEHICQAATRAIADGFTKYTPVAGIPDLLEAISVKLKRDNNLDYSTKEILVSTGAKQSLANAVLSIVNPGDEVVIPVPYWVTYSSLVTFAGGKPVFVDCGIEDNYKITPEKLEQHISPATKLFMFSSPCNPSGAVYSREELQGLASVFVRYPQVAIISDEIYEFINYSGRHESIAQFTELRDRVVVVNGMSKGFAMTGWRLGYMAGPANLVQACDKIQAQFTSGANSITQKASVEALLGDLSATRKMVDAFRQRKEYVIGVLAKIPGIQISEPGGAFYAFPDVSAFYGRSANGYTVQNDDDMAMYLLNVAHVATVCGTAFGTGKCIRISFAASMTSLTDAMARITKALGDLK
jgi:aspartate aminotransferase